MSQPRRRHRNTFVCTFCKRRKVRCDKGSPCSTCVKYGNVHCEYVTNSHFSHPPFPSASSDEFPEPMLLMDPPLMASVNHNSTHTLGSSRSHSSGSIPSVSSYTTAQLLTPAVHSELEMLKQKIQMLEKLVLYSQSNVAASPLIWSGGVSSGALALLGYNPCASDDEQFSFQDNYMPFILLTPTLMRYCAPLSWPALVKVDNAVSSMFGYKRKSVMRKVLSKEFAKDPDNLNPSERFFRQKITNDASMTDDDMFREAASVLNAPRKMDSRKQLNEKARIVGLTVFEGDLEEAHDTLEKIQLILPTLKVIWMLIDRFFARVYPFFPFIDQFDFEEKVIRILGTKSRAHEKVTKLHVGKKLDMMHLALLLVVLRFGYLTLFTNSDAVNEANLTTTDPSQRAQEIKFLMLNQIDIDFIDVAQLCLLQFGYVRVSSLPYLQLCLFMKLYHSFAPENSDSLDETNSHSYTAMLINMAMSLGMHREPDKIKAKVKDDRTSNLCRKIWWYLLIIDLQTGMSNGSSPCTSREMFDTSPPYFKPGNENVRDIEVEKEAVSSLRRVDRCFDDLNCVVRKISSVGSINLKQLCQQLSHLEIEYIKDQRPFTFEPNSLRLVPVDVSQAIGTKIYFNANFFLVSIAFHLFNHYERSKQIDLAYFYLKKVVSVAVYNTMPFYEDFVDKSHVWFQNSTDMAVTPSFQSLVHKCMIVLQAIMARARFSQLQCETLPSHEKDLLSNPKYKLRYETLIETYTLCDRCLSCYVEILSRLSGRYYYSWRCIKAYEGLKPAREGTEYYLSYCKGKEGYMLFTTEMLEDLNDVLRESLDIVRKNQLQNSTPRPMEGEEILGPGMNGTSVPPETPGSQLPENIDAWWIQMLTMKPQINKGSIFSKTPPQVEDLDLGLGTFDFNSYLDEIQMPPDNNLVFEPIFDEPIRLDL